MLPLHSQRMCEAIVGSLVISNSAKIELAHAKVTQQVDTRAQPPLETTDNLDEGRLSCSSPSDKLCLSLLLTLASPRSRLTIMIDPLSALSVATAILQFVEFGYKIVSHGRSLYKLTEGATAENKSLEEVNIDLASYTDKLDKSLDANGVSLSDKDKDLEKLRKECHKLALELQTTLEKLKVKDHDTGVRRGWNSLRKAIKGVQSESKISDMAARLDTYRQEIGLRLLSVIQ